MDLIHIDLSFSLCGYSLSETAIVVSRKGGKPKKKQKIPMIVIEIIFFFSL